MRMTIFVGIALCGLVVIATAVGQVIHVVNLFGPSAGEPAAPYADDSVTGSRVSPSEVVRPSSQEVSAKATNETPQELSAGLDEALRTISTTGARSKRGEPEPLGPLPQAALDPDLHPMMAEMRLDQADPGVQVEGVAQKLAPTLAREALEHSADNAPRNAYVEHELLETWKEQKEILAGQRGTVDSLIIDTAQ